MYCAEHNSMIRCCSLQQSECEYCKKVFTTFNAPPVDKLCKECSEKLLACAYCGENLLKR